MQTGWTRWIGARIGILLGGVLLGGLLLGGSAAAPAMPTLTGASDALTPQPARRAPVAPPDTLRRTVTGGQALLLALPDRLGTRPVDGYAMLNGPALSGVVGHAFAWKTTPADTGTHSIDLLAAHPEPPADTLVVFVFVE